MVEGDEDEKASKVEVRETVRVEMKGNGQQSGLRTKENNRMK